MNPDLLNKPIIVPANPFWKVIQTFGRDEFIAGLISIIVTAIVEGVFYLWKVPPGVGAALVLSLAGPIFEKVGFFVGHLNDARKVFKETPEHLRKTRRYYLKQAFRGGAKSLVQDIIVHDPIYIGLMFGGMYIHPQTPAWLLVPVAFGIAVLVVAVLEVGVHELRYWLFKRRLFGLGFEPEVYYESRFYIKRKVDASAIITGLRDQFFPGRGIRTLQYNDTYLKGCQNLPEYNGRQSKIRLRTRTDAAGTWVNTVQVIYSRTIEEKDGADQFRYFPKKKDKIYLMLKGEPEDKSLFSHFISHAVQSFLIGIMCGKSHPGNCPESAKIEFIRQVVNDPTLLISIDTVNDSYHVVEIKAYPQHSDKLKAAMRYVMYKYPVMQITHGKSDLLLQDLAQKVEANVG
jgi:hypothetical protein